ncbi:MAG: hypothetical protein H6551_00710 [Chitinophagales bacterium]|nr:hypothetical protein [Chitinophagaceae bacterium]MCB9063643.1 hypothetical protein [Chitinophagales bacterium]
MKKTTAITVAIFATALSAFAGQNTVTVTAAAGQNDAALTKDTKQASEEVGLAAHKKLSVQSKQRKHTPYRSNYNIGKQQNVERTKNGSAERLKMNK